MSRDQLFHFFFLAFFIYLLYQASRILEPFLLPFLGAVVLGFVAYPVHVWLSKMLHRWSKNFRSAISTLVIILLVVGPSFGIIRLLVREGENVSPLLGKSVVSLQNISQGSTNSLTPWLQSVQRHIGPFIPTIDVQQIFADMGQNVLDTLSHVGRKLLRNTVLSIVNIGLMIFLLFFLFRDGEEYLHSFIQLVPMRSRNKQDILYRIQDTLTGIIRGTVLNSLIQTGLALVGLLLAGAHAAVVLSILVGFAAFVPFVGTSIVWVPLIVYYFAMGLTKKAIFLIVWGVAIMWFLDHLLRPFLIRGKANLPILFLFVGLFGGAKAYGFRGLLIGPMVMTIIPVCVDIYAEQYLYDKNAQARTPHGN